MIQFEQMVDVVFGWLSEVPIELVIEFKNTKKENLSRYHLSLGSEIRNEFGLWKNKWDPVIIDGVDVSPEHPDSVAMRVIEAVWIKTNNTD